MVHFKLINRRTLHRHHRFNTDCAQCGKYFPKSNTHRCEIALQGPEKTFVVFVTWLLTLWLLNHHLEEIGLVSSHVEGWKFKSNPLWNLGICLETHIHKKQQQSSPHPPIRLLQVWSHLLEPPSSTSNCQWRIPGSPGKRRRHAVVL